MSQLTFSHQFSKRWLNAPEHVRHAIVQELEDIIILLDQDTELDNFEFRHQDLDTHINAIYQSQLSQYATTSKEAPVASDAQLDMAQTKMSVINDENANTNSVAEDKDAVNSVSRSDDTSAKTQDGASNRPVSSMNPASTKQVQADSYPNKALLAELERKIDDYLSEQLTAMSEDLKAWLREEMSK